MWLIRDLEPVPGDLGKPRLLRGGMLANALAERGHEVSWFTSTFNHYSQTHRANRNESRRISDNLRIEILSAPGYRPGSTIRRAWHNRCFASAYLKFAQRSARRPDVIMTDIPTTESADAAVRTARRWAIPSVVSVRDLWPDLFRDFAPPAMRPFLAAPLMYFNHQASYACRNADAVVGISARYLEWGLNKAGREQRDFDAVVPLGYKLQRLDAREDLRARDELTALGVDFSKTLVCFAGSWGATYDLEPVLHAADQLRTRSDIQFVLAGDGNKRPGLKQKIDTLPNVVAPGWLDAPHVATLLQACTVGLMPYLNAAPQGLPNKIFEHMAHGAFQISTLQGEAAELLSDLGVGQTVPPGDAHAMASAVVAALDDHDRQDKRDEIRNTFLARYDADVVYGAFVDHVERLVSAHAS